MAQPAEVDLHGFDTGAERASGWQDNIQKRRDPAKPPGGVTLQDNGEVNTVQLQRVAELEIPVEDDVATATEVDLDADTNDPPDFATAPFELQLDAALLTAAQYKKRRRHLDEAQKMGLLYSNTEAKNQMTTDRFRMRDMEVVSAAFGSRGLKRYMKATVPPFAHDVERSDEMPGSASNFLYPRLDNPVVNDLEQITVTNPEATRLLLDKATFCPDFRGLQTYPAAMRQFLVPIR
jgi:hypothetical protein